MIVDFHTPVRTLPEDLRAAANPVEFRKTAEDARFTTAFKVLRPLTSDFYVLVFFSINGLYPYSFCNRVTLSTANLIKRRFSCRGCTALAYCCRRVICLR